MAVTASSFCMVFPTCCLHILEIVFIAIKVKEGLGGNVRVILSGAAPLATHVEEYLRVVTCAHVLQGYGTSFSLLGIRFLFFLLL